MSDTELMQELTKQIYTIKKILKYDLKQDEKFVYQRDIKEILEMLGERFDYECSCCGKEFESIEENPSCPYCHTGDVIKYENSI